MNETNDKISPNGIFCGAVLRRFEYYPRAYAIPLPCGKGALFNKSYKSNAHNATHENFHYYYVCGTYHEISCGTHTHSTHSTARESWWASETWIKVNNRKTHKQTTTRAEYFRNAIAEKLLTYPFYGHAATDCVLCTYDVIIIMCIVHVIIMGHFIWKTGLRFAFVSMFSKHSGYFFVFFFEEILFFIFFRVYSFYNSTVFNIIKHEFVMSFSLLSNRNYLMRSCDRFNEMGFRRCI